jgi:hypothetical protein
MLDLSLGGNMEGGRVADRLGMIEGEVVIADGEGVGGTINRIQMKCSKGGRPLRGMWEMRIELVLMDIMAHVQEIRGREMMMEEMGMMMLRKPDLMEVMKVRNPLLTPHIWHAV